MIRSPQQPTSYRLRVVGRLDPHWSPWLGDLTLTRHDDGTTSLTGAVGDQAQLHGLLTKIRDLGVTLLSLAVLDCPDTVGTRTCPSGSVASMVLDDDPKGTDVMVVAQTHHTAGGI